MSKISGNNETYKEDFTVAFYDSNNSYTLETIDGHELSWGVNNEGTLVVILPCMVIPNSLNNNLSIQKVGERITQLKLLTSRSTCPAQTTRRQVSSNVSQVKKV